ncbi:MAG: glucosamine-6-phosphate deaminase [Sphaerochaetaceae bacterium]|jgi:glucosamine-6-phosphate deaminase|nr:glucosamine-6-phosphate deaminase [Sphaerochaetaceae bacterium]MDD4260438.1 glucosamine-6-phosphate deaminase [Sphaerochaetaceae bacterium]MDD5076747.1 glucosamine-6-phosphate deaminase [Sphaerochaetaceae bacterium]MDX9933427.1 glucosamine-6-phosphate deaminase [Sphaerochaetaceae bacterium]NLO59906.1 glucosamine-6-phosphate deaminase [Spirochaetales bacterium]
MVINVYDNQLTMAQAAAEKAAIALKDALSKKDTIRLLAATGSAQFKFLDALLCYKDIDWSRVEVFHLDEYVGISKDHPASFAGYIQHYIVDRFHPAKATLINGMANLDEEVKRLSTAVKAAEIDVAFLGIGENGHLAFNDPPADFKTEQPYLVVDLDTICRNQQVGEGWFPSLKAVPEKAFTMSVSQIMKSKCIFCIVPEKRKAQAVKNCLSDDAKVDPMYPSSILKLHGNAHIYLDKDSASLL